MWRIYPKKQGKDIVDVVRRQLSAAQPKAKGKADPAPEVVEAKAVPKAEEKAAPSPKSEAKAAPPPKAEAKAAPPPKAEAKAAPPPKAEAKAAPPPNEAKAAPPPKAEAKAAPPPKAKAPTQEAKAPPPAAKAPLPAEPKASAPKAKAAPPPPPPPPPPVRQTAQKAGGFSLFKFLGVALPVAGAGVVGYSWYDSDFRKQVESNVPYSKDLLSYVLPAPEPETVPKPKKKKPALAPALDGPLPIPEPVVAPSTPSIEPVVPEKKAEPVAPAKEEPILVITEIFPPTLTKAYCSAEENYENTNNNNAAPDKCFHYGNPSLENLNALKLKRSREYLPNDKDEQSEGDASLLQIAKESTPEVNSPEDTVVSSQDPEVPRFEFYDSIPYFDTDKEAVAIEAAPPAPEPVPPAPVAAPAVAAPAVAAAVEPAPPTEPERLPPPIPEVPVVAEPTISQEELDKAENAALEVAIHKLLSRSEVLAEALVAAQATVVATTQTHVKLLKLAMDDNEVLKKDDQWEAVAVAFREKENATFRSNETAEEALRSIEKVKELLALSKEGEATRANPAIYPATRKIVEISNAIGAANAQVRQAESEARVMLKYKELVDKGKRQFQQELESLLPDVKLGNTSKKLTEDELNSLIAHAHRRIEQLQRQLAEQMAMERQRLSAALESQRDEDQAVALGAVADERTRCQAEFDSEKHKIELDHLVRTEHEVRRQLARQAAAHSDHIKDVLSVQREQLSLDYSRELNAKILEERETFQSEVATWISRLHGIEAAVDARAASEQLARAAQDLWLACIALSSVITFGNEDNPETLLPLRNEVDAILTVGKKHPFVETLAASVPAAALDRGVFTEEQLRRRFVKVSTICRRLGLVTESNASLYQYLVSMLHSLVVFENVSAASVSDSVDLNSLDNHSLVAHAQHFMQQGDLEAAVRLMCQLTGESAKAASDWITEAKLLLETRQAAASLTAYASATGLANTF